MPRNPRARPASHDLLQALLTTPNADPEAVRQDLERIQNARQQSREESVSLDRHLIQEIRRRDAALSVARKTREQLGQMVEKLTAPPLHPAIFLETVTVAETPAAVVCHEGNVRVVVFGADVKPGALGMGDDVLLGQELNVLVAKSPCASARCGQTATFERRLPDGRLVLSWREEEVLVNAGGGLRDERLARGDVIRWNRPALLATEKIERSGGEHFFLEDTPEVTFDAVGGLDAQIEELQNVFRLAIEHAEVARRYGVGATGSVLLWGPPGTGKTMLAKALANWLTRFSPTGRSRFMNVKPGGLGSMWYSQTEANIREIFRIARRFGEENPDTPTVIFFDEFDSIGEPRGESVHRVDDRVQLALAAELDGLEGRGNVFVVAATNRRDALDAALVRSGRLGDKPIEVPRPNREAARSILGKYLSVDHPYALDGHDPAAARDGLLAAAVSRLYSPNGESEIARVTFRDGTERVLRAADLASGAGLAKIARDARDRACLREVRTGRSGIRLSDLMESIADELDGVTSLLTPRSCRRHVQDLPQDVEVVRVESLRRAPASRSHRYLEIDGPSSIREVAA